MSAGRPAPEPLYNIADDAVVRIEKLENEKYELERVIAEMEYASKQIALMNLRTYGG